MATLDDFLSFLQGASNSAASVVSAPVDGINWALGKVGVPVSKKPVGGSEWLKELGFTAEPQNKTAGLLGEAVGGVLPIVAQAKAPQIAAGINQMISNAQAPRTLNPQTGAIVWHGSKDPSWIDRGEAFNPNMTANMPSKYMWVNSKKDVAKSYAGISDMQLEKAASGLGSYPSPNAGIRKLDLSDSAKVLKVKDIKKASNQLGIQWGGENPLESFLDAARSSGYDAVKMEMDGGNIAILNPDVVKYGPSLR